MYSDTGTRFVKPDVVTSHFHLRAGDRVADFGAGSGYFLRALSNAVSADGRVYACEIQKNLVETLALVAQSERLPNVEALWCDIEMPRGVRLQDGVLDAGIFVNTLYAIEEKDAALTEAARVTRKGGKLIIIDWTDSFAGLGPRPDHVVTADVAQQIAERAGFLFDHTFPAGEHHYGLMFRKQ